MDTIKIKKSPLIKCELQDKEYPQFIRDFINTLKEKDLSNFYNNLNTISIKSSNNKSLTLAHAGAEYDVFNNRIVYLKHNFKNNIMHELLHAASRYKIDGRYNDGFMQVLDNGLGFGVGLNEGYTALLDDRYFLDYDKRKIKEMNQIYPTSKYICNILDYLIGKDKMEDYYFHGDLYGLAKELSIYSSPYKTYKFLINLDKLFTEADNKPIPNIFVVLKEYENCILYLSECFTHKFNMALMNGTINKDEYNKLMLFVEHIMNERIKYFKIIKSRKLSIYKDNLELHSLKKIARKK